MSYANVGIDTTIAALGKFIQRVHTEGVYTQISEDFRDWEMVSRLKVGEDAPRELAFMLQTSLGAPSVKWSKQGSGGSFPSHKSGASEEYFARFKQLYSTIELEYDLWQRALKTPAKYAEPMAKLINDNGIVQRRLLSSAFHRDGTGQLGQASSVGAVSGGQFTVTFGSAYGERHFEWDDEVVFVASGGTTERTHTGSSSNVLKVVDKDRENNTVTFASAVAADTITATTVAGTDYCFRNGESAVDIAGFVLGTTDYATVSENMCGLDTLAAADGRVVHGITMSGALKGTKYNCGSVPIDLSHLQAGLDKLRTRVGQGKYKYSQLLAAPETNAAIIKSQETDRRLVSVSDDKRGFKGFGYIHNNDQLLMQTSEFCKPLGIWVIPEKSKASGVLELHGTDFAEVKVGGVSEYLKADSGYSPAVQKFMMAIFTMICRHPAAILEINGFTVS